MCQPRTPEMPVSALDIARERARSDLWCYFDDMILDLEEQSAPPEVVDWAKGWRTTLERMPIAAAAEWERVSTSA